MTDVVRPVSLAAVLIALAGCNIVDRVGGSIGITTGPCSSFNRDPQDAFRISLTPTSLVLEPGATQILGLTRSWITDSGSRSPLECAPEWRSSPGGIASVDGGTTTLQAIAIGITQLTVYASGADGEKSDSSWVAVVPHETEVEPNGSSQISNTLAAPGSAIGAIGSGSDLDWYSAEIPPGQGYEFTVASSPGTSSNDPFSGSYSLQTFDATLHYAPASGRNTTASPLLLYVRVDGSIKAALTMPYALKLALVN